MEYIWIFIYGEVENFIDSGIVLFYLECILLVCIVGMVIVLIKILEDILWILLEKIGIKVKVVVLCRGVVFVKFCLLGVFIFYLFIGKVFDVFEKYKVFVYLVIFFNVSVLLVVKCSNDILCLIYCELYKYVEIGMEIEMFVVSVIGDLNWEKYIGLEVRIIEMLKEMLVCMILYGSSIYNFLVLVWE